MNAQGRLAVVVPAWNEEGVVAGCLASVLGQRPAIALTVVVVANGCRDATAAVARGCAPLARRHGHELVVVELATRGKAAALDAGDARCPPGSHRLYLDADVRLSSGSLDALVAAFAGGAELAAPRLVLDTGGAGAVLRGYWRCWAALPTVRNQVVGAGAYGVSAAGRARWGAFPDLVADDLWVRRQFAAGEGRVLDDVTFTTATPATVRGTLRMLARWRRGNAEQRGPGTSVGSALVSARRTGGASARDLAAFVALSGAARALAAVPRRAGAWERGR